MATFLDRRFAALLAGGLGFLIAGSVVVAWLPQGQPMPPPQSPPVANLLPEIAAGDAAFERQDWAAAVEHYRKAIDQGIGHGVFQMRLGYALHALGRYNEALPHHLKAAAMTYREIRIDGLYNAACAYALTGDREKSLEFLAKAIDAGFKDTAQVGKDSDLDSLRDEERFKRLVGGIGQQPALHQWMDFFIGSWEQRDENGEILDGLTIRRPLSKSSALTTTSTNIGGGQWTGLLWPDAEQRQWRWVSTDDMGSAYDLTGRRTEEGGMVFAGRERTPVGMGAHLRLTFTPQADGCVLEKAEVSMDGQEWRVHHEAQYERKAAAID